MNILSISTDRAILKKGSGAREKALWLANAFSHTHLVIFTTEKNLAKTMQLSENLTVHPTASLHPLLYIFDAYKIAKKIVSQSNIEYTTCQDPFLTGLVGLALKKSTNTHLQIQVHTDISSEAFQKFSVANRVRMFISTFILPRATSVRVVSERIKNYLEKQYQTKNISVLPVYIYCENILNAEAHDLHAQYNAKHIILTASRLEGEKQIEKIIDAFVKARIQIPESVLLIVGSGSLEMALRTQAESSEAHSKIHFVSWTNELASYLKGTDTYISASVYEGFGLSLVEAALAGCAIISTPVGVIGHELTTDVWTATTVEEIAQALVGASKQKTSFNLKEDTERLCIDKNEYLKQYFTTLIGNR